MFTAAHGHTNVTFAREASPNTQISKTIYSFIPVSGHFILFDLLCLSIEPKKKHYKNIPIKILSGQKTVRIELYVDKTWCLVSLSPFPNASTKKLKHLKQIYKSHLLISAVSISILFSLKLTGDKPHSCDLCNKKFALACNLRAHMKTHEGKQILTGFLFKTHLDHKIQVREINFAKKHCNRSNKSE